MTAWESLSVFLLGLFFMIPTTITVVACASYWARVRSAAAVALVSGAAGELLVGVSGALFRQFASPVAAASSRGPLLVGSAQFVLGLIGLGFAFLFSVSLFRVLRQAARSSPQGNLVPKGEPAGP